MRITELFTAQSIALDVAAPDQAAILDKLVDLQATHGNITDKDAYKKALYAREAEASTYVDNGITVPHARTACVTRPSLAALRLSTPVQYNADDDGKTDLLFAIAAPENGSLHIDMLARMMQMLMNDDFVEKLRAAKTPAEFLDAIDAQEDAQFGEESFTQQEIPRDGYRVLAVTACPNGIAHTYMAAEALTKMGDKLGLPTKVETNGSDGAKNVLTPEEIAAEMMNYRGSGMCVMEMSHRSKVFQQIRDEAEADLRQLMGIPDNYKVLFVQGGGTVQFAMVPMNLMKNGVACYVETGNWSKKAIKEAQKYGEVKIVASSADKNFSYIPDCSDLDIPDNADYVYICENETINGTTYFHLPNTKGKILVSDQSSMFLSRPCDVTKYGLIWAGVQKNVGPAGMAVVIIREDLLREDLPQFVPTYMSYKTHADNDSLYNTPNCWAIYCCGKVFKYLLANGGLEAMNKRNEEKAAVLYDFLDQSKFFTGAVRKEDRSLMNVPFVTPSKEQDADVVAASKAAGFDNLKGHKSVGGLRASIYNAMPKEGVEALVEFLKKYEAEHA